MSDASEFFLAKEKESKKTRFEEERKYAFHCERLSDNTSCGFRKLRPIGAKLKFHGNSGHHAHGKVDAENFCPESRRLVVVLVAGAQSFGLQINQEQRQTHGQLRENIVEGYREGEVQPVNVDSVSHAPTFATLMPTIASSHQELYKELKDPLTLVLRAIFVQVRGEDTS